MKNIILCDIDGTLADVRHRLHYILNPNGSKRSNPDWPAFHAACVDDPPFEDVIEVVDALAAGSCGCGSTQKELHFLSGRNEVARETTHRWLEKRSIGWGDKPLHMRKANDRRQDTVVKLEMVRELGFTPDKVLCIFDDRQSVVDMWRENGYRVMQVAAWKETV